MELIDPSDPRYWPCAGPKGCGHPKHEHTRLTEPTRTASTACSHGHNEAAVKLGIKGCPCRNWKASR